MKTQRKPSQIREKELLLALSRIQHGRAKNGDRKLTIAAVAREAGVSTALIHNHYPNITKAIREAQGQSSCAQRDVKMQDLIIQQQKNRDLRKNIIELRKKIASLASINEVLITENRNLKSKKNETNIIDFS